ncbi:protein QUIRKY-like [Panicum miliaceum]|uniref:Protein QUIRKY-like n=1 Tax=Panicum miliaceum TaxID=4540 RepID=A0A3L6SQ73_PANMI|nr:protein QUIRKY-like [Panicum miliaceum]
MHYAQPLEEEQQDFFSAGETAAEANNKLWLHAANILALRLDRMEPPLRREVVAYICNAESWNKNSSWSMRRSKANFFRLMQVLAPLIRAARWSGDVISSKNPLATLLIHAVLVLALWFPELVLPLVLVYLVLVGVWNYRFRPRTPPYVSTRLSYVDTVHRDELDKEFDTVPSQADNSRLRMRYDRLRHVAGRVQVIAGDVATRFEKIESFFTWRDPRVTAMFMLFLPVAAAVAYFVPYKKILVALAGFYIMRHPRLRRGDKTPSIIVCFFGRSPSKVEELI